MKITSELSNYKLKQSDHDGRNTQHITLLNFNSLGFGLLVILNMSDVRNPQ